MDEGIETRQDAPAFILNALKQLISLKSNITSIDDFHNDVKHINFGDNTDSTDFANKLKEFLDTLQIKVSDINNTFIKSYETFIIEKGSKNTKTCKRKSDGENTNSDSSGVTQEKVETGTFTNDIIENSDSDIPLVKVSNKKSQKSSKQKKNENSGSDTNLQKQKTPKRRRKRGSSRIISECDNSDSNSKSSSIQNIMSDEISESEEQVKVKSKIKPDLSNEDDKCKTNSDSDKENTKNINTKPKEIIIENNLQSESPAERINSDLDSEKETSGKISTKKAKKVVESNSETDSGIKKSKENKKKTKQVKEDKTKKVTVSDVDSDLNIRKSKVGKSKYKRNAKSKSYISNSESDTDKNNCTDSEKSKSKSNDLKNKMKQRIVSDSDSDSNKTIITNANKTKKGLVSDSDSKSEKSKSKIVNDSESDLDEFIVTNAEKTKKELVCDSESNLEKNKSKSDDLKKKSKIVNDSESDLDESIITNADKSKKNTVSDNDLESAKNKSNDDLKNKKGNSKTELGSEKRKSKRDNLKNKKKSKIVNESNSDSDQTITIKANKTKEDMSDNDLDLAKSNSKSDDLKNKKKYNPTDSDSEKSETESNDLKNKKKSKTVNDSDSNNDPDSAKSKSKCDDLNEKKKDNTIDSDSEKSETESNDLKNKKKSKTVNDSDSDSTKSKSKSDDLNKKKKDNTPDSDSEKSKTERNDLKKKKKSKIVNDSDLDSAKSKSKSDDLKKKKKHSETDSDSESSKSKSDGLKNKKKSKIVSDSDSDETIIVNADKTKKVTVSDSDSESEKNQSETDDSKKKKDSDIRESNAVKEKSIDSEKANTVDKVRAASIDSDSDSYIEDPRSIIEKYKKSQEEKRKSAAKTKEINLFDSLKESHNTETNDDTPELDESLKGSKKLKNKKNSEKNKDTTEANSCDSEQSSVSLIFNLSSSSNSSIKLNEAKKKTDDTVSDDSTNDNESLINTPNENSQQIKEESAVNDEDNEADNEKKDTPKIGLIKCIDISKLLDPNVKKIEKSPKLESSVIILSSSESEGESKSERKKQKSSESTKNKKNDEKLNRTENSRNKVKHEEKSNKKSPEKDKNKHKKEEKTEIETIDSDSSSSNDRKRRLRFNRKKEKVSNTSFEQFRLLRQRRTSKKTIVEKSSSSSSSDSDSSDSSIKTKSMSDKTNNKRPRTEKISEIDPNYDYKNDIKFKTKCYISLPRIPVEKLKAHYCQGREDAEINRLTNMKSLKRTRQQKGTSSSSDNDAKTVKKRGKLQRKKVSEDEEQSEHSNNSMSDVPIIQEKKKDANPPIPEDLLDSDGDSNKHSDSADDEDKDKKKSKNDDKKKSGKKTDTEKEKDNAEENGKDSEKEKEDKEKKKWRNDPLLRGKLSASDSDDELIRFRNKKNKIAEDIRSEPEEETIVSKKSKTKKQLKRIARRLGSDISSSDEDKDEYKKSDSENENSDKSDKTSDSEDDTNKKKPVRRRIKRMKDSEESSDGDDSDKKEKKKKKEEDDLNTRKKIRHVWSKDSLADSTKEAAKEEQERKKRIADRQRLYNEIYDNKLDSNAEVDKVVLDFNEDTKEELLSVHPDLVKKLKPHQAQGVQFMWTACFESLERAQNTEGSGCILAHCMGLGKTLQVITLIHTLLCNTETSKVKTVLVVCPLSTVLNWVSEFKKWLDDIDGEQVNVFDLVQYKQNYERLYQMQDWVKFGGVMVMGYDMFRNLSNPKGKRMSKKLINGFNRVLLEPGPDLVVCDEGHLLKNEKTGISIAMNRLKTLRRIVLTGTPLQNNLKEYFCMVQFVKPNLLGTYKEYLNRFVNPITNGQYTDSTLHDIQIMRKRAHVLHKMLDAVVERRDYNVLAPFLPPKHEYVLFVSLSPVQIELYREYLTKFSRNTSIKGTSYLFQDFQELQRICIHPRVLLDKSNQDKLRREMDDDDSEGSLKDFIDDDESDKSASSSNESSTGSDSESEKKPAVPARRTRANPGNAVVEEPELFERSSRDEWWSKFCQGDELDNICHSSKIKLLFDILHQCELIGDKVLVFSQSLYSLNLIEYFLAKVDEATQSGDTESLEKVGGHTASWAIGLDYFRMDGSTSCENRATWCKTFNNDANTRARLFLISTRAGGLGINLVAANRVIIFDVSWNPSFDIQSIYRVYRFGQTKPCYIYRFVTMGTMENKIYERQVTKQAISKRVIDEQQIDRHYNQTDLAELYAFVPIPDEERPTPLVPKDRLFADLLQTHDKQIFKYHEHNSLLEDKADEGLNEEERQAAWEEFENEKTAPKFNLMQTMVRNGMFETLRILVQEDNNGWTPAQINNILPAVVQRISEQVARGDYSMYRRVEERHEIRVLEQRRMQMIYQQYMQQLRSASGGAPMTPADMNKLAQMFSAYNQTLAAQQQMQPRAQIVAGSSAAVSFTQGDPPPLMTPAPPIPHPSVSEVVELND